MSASRFERPTDMKDLNSFQGFLAEDQKAKETALAETFNPEVAKKACEFMTTLQMTHASNMNFLAENWRGDEFDDELLNFTVLAGFAINKADEGLRQGNPTEVNMLSGMYEIVARRVPDAAERSYLEGHEYEIFCRTNVESGYLDE